MRKLRPATAVAATGSAAAVAMVALGRQGGYEIGTWAPLGVGVAAVAAAALAAGVRPPRLVVAATATLLAVGAWSVASVAWGGLPQVAWQTFDQSAVAGGALLAGSVAGRRRGLAVGSLLAALTLSCGAIVARLALTGGPRSWFYGRYLDGPVGYHNAQAAVAASGVCLAVGVLLAQRRSVRAAEAASATVCVAALLLTQSRGGVLAAAVGVASIVALARDARLLARVGALAGGAATVAWALRKVDAALVDGAFRHEQAALQRFGAVTLAAAVVCALAVLPDLGSKLLRRGAAVALVLALATAALAVRPTAQTFRAALDEMGQDAAPVTKAGETRFVALTLNGRLDAWRVALGMANQNRLLGGGAGTFTRQWTVDRRHTALYIIQPHSVELELLSELGPVGLLLFALFFVSLLAALVRRRSDPLALGAAGAVVALVAQASVDWTWSFPAVVATTLAAAGAAIGGTRRSAGDLARVAAPAAALALAAALVVPLLAARWAVAARVVAASDPATAWARVGTALALDPWDPSINETRGRIAEAAGDLDGAVRSYQRAASLSRHPWLDEYRAARVLRRANKQAAARAACARAVAGNPAEPALRAGPCSWPN